MGELEDIKRVYGREKDKRKEGTRNLLHSLKNFILFIQFIRSSFSLCVKCVRTSEWEREKELNIAVRAVNEIESVSRRNKNKIQSLSIPSTRAKIFHAIKRGKSLLVDLYCTFSHS